MKNPVMRNIKYWLRYSQVSIGIMILFGVGYTLLFNRVFDAPTNYMFTIACVAAFVIPMTYIMTYFPIIISFGSRRRDAVAGFQVLNIAVLIELAIASSICDYIFSDLVIFEENGTIILMSVMIWLISFGQIAGGITLRYGLKSKIVITIFIMSLVMTIAILIGIGLIGMPSKSIIVIIGLAGVLAYIASGFIFYKIISKYEVRNV